MIDQINTVAGHWFTWQWAMLWQSAILIIIIGTVDRLIQKWAWPQLRYALWLLVLVKLILPPTLSSPVSVTSPIPTWADKVQIVPVKTEPEAPLRETTSTISYVSDAKDFQPEPALKESVSVSETSGMAKTPLSWKAYAMGTWFLAVLALALGLAIRLRHLRKEHTMDPSQHVPDWLQEALETAAHEIGCRRLPAVVLSRRVLCPAVFGLFRPVLLVPEDQVEHMSPTDARHILLHELAHIKRLDLWTHGLYMGLLMAYWFNPLLWLMRRHLQNLRELCCDATVARYLREHTPAYRVTLLETAKSLLAKPVDPGLGLLGLFENSTWLVTRLQWLEKKTWRYSRTRVLLVSLSVIGMLCCVLPMAAGADWLEEDYVTIKLPNSGVWLSDIDGHDLPVLDFKSESIEVLAQVSKEEDFYTRIDTANRGDVLYYYDAEKKLPKLTFMRGPGFGKDRATAEYDSLTIIPPQVPDIEDRILNTRDHGKYRLRIMDANASYCTIYYQPVGFGKTPSSKKTITSDFKMAPKKGLENANQLNLQEEKLKVNSIAYAYITGSVNGTGPIIIPADRPTKLTEVIAKAGGIQNHSASVIVEITRRINSEKEIIIRRELSKIANGSETDPEILENDMVNVWLGSSHVLTLVKPKYEWWLASPTKQMTVQQGRSLDIEWSIAEDLYKELEFLAVGVVPDGVDVSENKRYQWLANDIPITVRKTLYGKDWPVSYELMGKANKMANPLVPGSYCIIVFGFKGGGGDGIGDWRFILNNNLVCVAVAQLKVEPVPADAGGEVVEIRNAIIRRLSQDTHLTPQNKEALQQELSLIAKKWLFSDEVIPGDTLCEYYTVKPGDTLAGIGRSYKVPYQCLLRINGASNASSLQAGQALKVAKGPFHAKVWRTACKMDLYLQDMYVKTYDIGLGRPDRDIPTGQWVIKEAGKLRGPPWIDPDTGRRLNADDPDYPLGEGYMGLKGVLGDAVSRQGFGIHGTQDKTLMGKHTTNGTIAMQNTDFLEVFDLLMEDVSRIDVID